MVCTVCTPCSACSVLFCKEAVTPWGDLQGCGTDSELNLCHARSFPPPCVRACPSCDMAPQVIRGVGGGDLCMGGRVIGCKIPFREGDKIR